MTERPSINTLARFRVERKLGSDRLAGRLCSPQLLRKPHDKDRSLRILKPTPENGLSKRSASDTFQVRSVSQQRLI